MTDSTVDPVRALDPRFYTDAEAFAADKRVSPVPTTAAALIDEAVHDCEAVVASAGVDLRVMEPEVTGEFDADTCLMTQAIGNVVRNAAESLVEAAQPEPVIEITATRRRGRGTDRRTEPQVVIAVADNGPGIPPAQVDRIFNPFFTTREAGTGLGLAIVHRIVDAHGGCIRVDRSTAGGASVELCLPLHHPRPGTAGSDA